MKEYILEKFEELSEEYLQDNCTAIKEYADYGDTQVVSCSFYTDSDIQDSHNHAIDYIESEIKDAMKELNEKYGVTTDQFLAAVQKAKENLK
jgi:hypothetical protein